MKELLFAGYGIEIFRRDGRLFIDYDGGEIATVWKEHEISEEEAREAQEGPSAAYEVIMRCQRRSKSH
jgi:hypothetical protein